MRKLISLLKLKPALFMLVSFAVAIAIGTILLSLPISVNKAGRINFIDALFTATSATCVTGLIVKDTGGFFSSFGQSIILILIQMGGLGIMTFSVSLALLMGQKVDKRQEVIMQNVLDNDTIKEVVTLVKFIFKMTIFVELVGIIFLFFHWNKNFDNSLSALYYAVFHSISGFCNAGFSLFSDNLMSFKSDIITIIIISLLIIIGGVGFIVIYDIKQLWLRKDKIRTGRLRAHTKLVLFITFILIVIGASFIFIVNNNSEVLGENLKEKLFNAYFLAVTARTAGFNTVDLGGLSQASFFIIMILMFIGASPGSTGGGIKTSTFGLILKAASSFIKNEKEVRLFKRTIPLSVINKAFSILIMFLTTLCFFALILFLVETDVFVRILFESISAFGTVGLSLGTTHNLTFWGKIVVIMLMFVGRLGPLTIVLSLTKSPSVVKYSYAEERVLVG
jgi:trk system potassium uptake protein TrkH